MNQYDAYSKEDLITQIKALKAHNTQLQNIIAKKNDTFKHQEKRKKPFDFQKYNFRHVLLKFFYLGWDYQGYVTQEDTMNTIEHHVFEALIKTCLIEKRATSNYHRCGRTDKGVSSFSQVISIDLRSVASDTNNELKYCKLLNRVLPDNIQFVAWAPVDSGFSARFDCKNRTYKYFFPKGNLDVDLMKSASKDLIGNHDFRNFCKMDVNNGVVEFNRTILSVEIDSFSDDVDEYSIYVLTIKGNAFLWHQIRCILAILLLIGQHKEKPDLILELLDVDKNPRKPDYQMASEIPLNLYDCQYEDINWIYDPEAIAIAGKKLRNFWTFSDVRSAMVKSMLTDLELKSSIKQDCLSENLLQGVKTRTYIPVMKRKLCDSLEDKIEHHLKRQQKKTSDSTGKK